MSGAFYAGDNIGLGEDASEAKRIISERIATAKAKKAKKQAFWKNVAGLAISFGMNAALSGPKGTAGSGEGGGFLSGLKKLFGFGKKDDKWLGGPIRKYAPGGFVSGTPGIDQIPAMLSEGEYVIKNSSVRQLGKPMLDRINAGKFNNGGPTTPLMEQSESSSGGGGSTNNINISVNIEGGGKESEDSSVENPKEGSDKTEGNAELAQKIKAQVVNVILEEQRPGGLLS